MFVYIIKSWYIKNIQKSYGGFYSMTIGIITLAVLSLVFSFIGARSRNKRWIFGPIVCSLAAGILCAIIAKQEGIGTLGYFGTAVEGGFMKVVDYAATALVAGGACFVLSRVIGGLIRPLSNEEAKTVNNPVWRLLLYVLCTAFGIAWLVYFICAAAGQLIAGAGTDGIGYIVMICAGALYTVAGIGGCANWRARKRKADAIKQKWQEAEENHQHHVQECDACQEEAGV